MPGNPVDNLCPKDQCTEESRQLLVEQWHMDSPQSFYANWVSNAVQGEFGRSSSQNDDVGKLLGRSFLTTALVIAIALVPVILASVLSALGWIPQRLDGLWQAIGLVPLVILALFAVAFITINFGPPPIDAIPLWEPGRWAAGDWFRVVLGGLVLGIADGVLASAILGTRSVFDAELNQRYIGIAVLRGESVFSNAMPNVTPALVGQLRGRVLLLISGSVIVEAVLQINGIADLLWGGAIKQDYFLVLAATSGFAVLSAALLFFQAASEVGVALWVRRSPRVAEPAVAPAGQAGGA